MPARLSKEQFIEKARQIHSDKYDYSLVEYVNNSTPVKIICPIHGEFMQTPNAHLRKGGCAKCGKQSMADKQSLTTETFIQKLRAGINNYSVVGWYSDPKSLINISAIEYVLPTKSIFDTKGGL